MASRIKCMDRPNILWVSFEDTFPLYPCYGDPTARLPHVETLAKEGTVYRHAFSTAGVCAPARHAVITGMYAASTGAQHMRTTHPVNPRRPAPYEAVVPHYVKCLPEYLRANGYYCTNNEKTDYQFQSPFTAWDECSKTAHWRNRPSPDTPFFSVFNPTMTHESGVWDENAPALTVDPMKVPIPPHLPDTPVTRQAIARLYSQLEKADAVLGKIIAELKEDGLYDKTVIFHWSDHGPLPRGKRWPYDDGIHVPLIIRDPKAPDKGQIETRLVSTVDLGPTVLSLCGVDIPVHMQGRAFLGTKAEKPREAVFAHRDRHDESYDMVRAVRTKKYKYIQNFYPIQDRLPWVPYLNRNPLMKELNRLWLENRLPKHQAYLFECPRRAEELYDVSSDPHELNNLIDQPEHVAEAERLRRMLADWQRDIEDKGVESEEELIRKIYPNPVPPTTEPPDFIPYDFEHDGIEPASFGEAVCVLQVPAALQLHCPTQGASIGYRIDNEKYWHLYTGRIRLTTGRHTIVVKAIRIGYAESSERTLILDVMERRAAVEN